MVIENDPSARMQLRTRGELVHPGRCMVCGNGNCDEGYLDLGVFFDYEGTMYLCFLCCTQAGETIGMFTPEEVKSQQELIEKLTIQNAQQGDELDHARPIVSIFTNALDDLANSGFLPTAIASEAAEAIADVTSEESAANEQDAETVTAGPDAGESEPAKPVKSGKRSGTNRPTAGNITF